MARLIHLKLARRASASPPCRRSTQSPGTLNLDVDALHRLVGGWQDEETDTWPVVWPWSGCMAEPQLEGRA